MNARPLFRRGGVDPLGKLSDDALTFSRSAAAGNDDLAAAVEDGPDGVFACTTSGILHDA